MRERFLQGHYSHPGEAPDTCGGPPVQAHTVQRNGGLGAIAEDGHVISIKAAYQDMYKNGGKVIPRKMGVRAASTFFGFCSRHDAEMFRPVEYGTVGLTNENCFLLSFRALAYEVIMKRCALSLLPHHRELDKGRPFDFQVQLQQYVDAMETGVRLGLEALERWKADYDAAFLSGGFNTFRHSALVLDGVMPIVGCGALIPEFDFEGSPLQRLGTETDLEHVTLNFTVLDGKTILVVGWIAGEQGPAGVFARSCIQAVEREGPDALIRLAFEHIENVYLRPIWWNSLPATARAALVRRTQSGGVTRERTRQCLMPDGVRIAEALPVFQRLDH
jgi:hypothetical protein